MHESSLRTILAKLNVPVVDRSRDWLVCACPFSPYTHERGYDRRPSFGALINSEGVSAYKCQACKLHGRISALVRTLERYRGVSYPGVAVEADAADFELSFGDFEIPIAQNTLPEPLNVAAYSGIYPSVLTSAEGLFYVHSRGITSATITRLELCYDPEQRRIIIPVYGSTHDELFGFTGRSIDADVNPKIRDYAGLPKRHLLLGEHLIRPGLPLIVVEGIFGWVWLMQTAWELANFVALLGSEMTPEKAQRLAVINAPTYLLFDNDAAGDIGLWGAVGPSGLRVGGAVNALCAHVQLFIPAWPNGSNDPDQLSYEDIKLILQTPIFNLTNNLNI